MEEIIAQLSSKVLRVQFNHPSRRNTMTVAMYAALAEEPADQNADVRVELVHGAGESFTVGNDVADFVSPPGPGDSSEVLFLDALIRFGKPLVTAVHGEAIGGVTTMLLPFDFVYARKPAGPSGPARNSSRLQTESTWIRP
jgi:enoyl-CoA hydratase/carnithine racemase